MFNTPKNWQDWVTLLTSYFSLAALFIKAAFHLDFGHYVNDFVMFLLLTIFLVVNAIGVWRHNFVGKTRKQQKEELARKNLL